jgi:hypothetical protein
MNPPLHDRASIVDRSSQELLEVWPVGGPTGVPAIVIAGSDQGPSGVGLALDIGRGGIVLRIQRVELLVKPMLSRDPRIDGAADRPYGRSLHGRVSIADRSSRRPKKRGPFHLVPVMVPRRGARLRGCAPQNSAPFFVRDGRARPPEATAERTPKLHRLGLADSRTTIGESDCPTGVWSLDASPRTTQPCFTIGHALSLRGRAASSAGTVASSLR